MTASGILFRFAYTETHPLAPFKLPENIKNTQAYRQHDLNGHVEGIILFNLMKMWTVNDLITACNLECYKDGEDKFYLVNDRKYKNGQKSKTVSRNVQAGY